MALLKSYSATNKTIPGINTGSSLRFPLTIERSPRRCLYATHFDFPVKFPFSPSLIKAHCKSPVYFMFLFPFRPFTVPSHEMLSQWLRRCHSMTLDFTLSAEARTLFASAYWAKHSILFRFSNQQNMPNSLWISKCKWIWILRGYKSLYHPCNRYLWYCSTSRNAQKPRLFTFHCFQLHFVSDSKVTDWHVVSICMRGLPYFVFITITPPVQRNVIFWKLMAKKFHSKTQ